MTTEEEKSVLTSSAVMAAGTVVSRLSGFVRGALLAAALGNGLHADLFNIANTIPNMLYILLAGGVFNAVLVPQLVRSMKRDDDGGAAYANRIITLAALFLGAVSLVLVVAAPLVMRLFLDPVFYTDALSAERDSAIAFARYCLPQVFFYGMFVLVGQVLNARGSFGPMMWAPIANNVVSVAILVAYLAIYGTAAPCAGGYSPDQELLLGLGSTLGIAVQLLVLLPYLRRAGFHYRARYDFRHTGLGHTLRLGLWTVLFVVVNQIAYTVVVRLSSTGTASAGAACGAPGHGEAATGYTVYSQTFLIMMVPHSVVTVSLATAILPALSRKAADADFRGVGRSLTSALRTALAVVLPFAALLPLVARDVSHLIWGYGSTSRSFVLYAPSLALFGPGLVFFTVHYLILRGFYALERTRTVFFIQCAVAATNIVLAVALVNATDAEHTSPALVVAYAASYAVGSAVSYVVLRRLLGGLETPRLVRFLARMAIVVGVSTLAAGVVAIVLHQVLPSGGPASAESWTVALVRLVVVSGVDGVVFLALARLLRVDEITSVTEMITRRLPGRAGR